MISRKPRNNDRNTINGILFKLRLQWAILLIGSKSTASSDFIIYSKWKKILSILAHKQGNINLQSSIACSKKGAMR